MPSERARRLLIGSWLFAAPVSASALEAPARAAGLEQEAAAEVDRLADLSRQMVDQVFFRPAMRKYYYDPAKYRTYLEQLGIAYPSVRK